MVIIFDKKTGNIVQTEDFRITSAFDSPEWRSDLEGKGLGWIGWPYELGTDIGKYKIAINDEGEPQGIVSKTDEDVKVDG